MKKILTIAFISIFTVIIGLGGTVEAATNDFTADSNITVSGVIINGSSSATVDMLIFSGSTAESWSFDNGVFTVVNPGSFSIGSSDATITFIQIKRSGSQVVCLGNGNPGTTSIDVPTAEGTYSIIPWQSSCAVAGIINPGGGSSTPSTYQSYNPNTGETTTTPPAETSPTQTPSTTSADENIANILADAAKVATQTRAQVVQAAGKSIDVSLETKYDSDIVARVVAGQTSVSTQVREKILTFVTYGTQTTEALGAGERGGVVNSFKEAFGKLPESESEWVDVIKIANGRWPSQISASRESVAEANFKAIYLRAPNRANPHDDAAVVVMAYGLRSRNRNLGSEKTAIKTYQRIFKHAPVTATAWDAVRAIAYSGATR